MGNLAELDADRLEKFEIVHPEATIDHSGMKQPIRGDEEPDYVRGIKAALAAQPSTAG